MQTGRQGLAPHGLAQGREHGSIQRASSWASLGARCWTLECVLMHIGSRLSVVKALEERELDISTSPEVRQQPTLCRCILPMRNDVAMPSPERQLPVRPNQGTTQLTTPRGLSVCQPPHSSISSRPVVLLPEMRPHASNPPTPIPTTSLPN